ncbi:MAG: hypothetical protein C5B50_15125 [Verrucomicrobia bacterium]|nr:MAG: hypothetical protein C5B50_15125 [Verrucomicrobiota bacterium]
MIMARPLRSAYRHLVPGILTLALAPLAFCAEPLTRPSHITFDSAGALVVDGQKVFPITLTIVPPPGSKTPTGKDAYEEFRDGGAWFMRSGGPSWTNQETLEKELRVQDAAAKHGMRCCPWMGWDLCAIKPGDTAREQQLRDVISKLKESPGMGLWKGDDEPEWGKRPPARVDNTARIIHEADPNHPIWLVQAPRGTVKSLKRYDAGWDVGGIDIYPISYPPGRHTEAANKEITMVGDFTRMMKEVAGSKPFWMTLQIAFSGATPPKGIIRFPSAFDQRFMCYEAIINGARGLVFFGGGNPTTLNERDAQLGWNWTYWDRILKPLLQEFVTSSPIAEALVAPDSQTQLKVTGVKGARGQKNPDASPMEFLVREAGDNIYIFACKKEGPAIQVRFDGLPSSCGTGQVLFEEPRVVESKAGSFTDWFVQYDVHVYRFKR